MKNSDISYSDYEIDNEPKPAEERKNKKNIIITIIITTIVILLLTFGIILLLKNNNSKINSISFEEKIINLLVGETKKINIIVDGEKPNKFPINWTSSNEEIVKVTNGEITANKEGTAIIKAVYKPKLGKKYTTECEVIVINDKPVITYEISNDNWTNKDITIDVNVSSRKKLKELKYSVNCTENCEYKNIEDNKIIISESGTNNVTIVAINELNASSEETVEIKIDKTKPTVDLINPQTTYNGDNKVKVCATCTDNESGCTKQEICKEYTKSDSNLSLSISDNAGNTGTSPKFKVVINNEQTGQTEQPSSVLTCKFIDPTTTSIKVGDQLSYKLECTDTKNQIKNSDLNANNFTLGTSGIIQISNVSKKAITNGYQYTINIKGLKEGKSNITLKSGSITTNDGNTNNAINSKEITVTKACTVKQSCGCEKYTNWISKGKQTLSASCSSNPSKTLSTKKWSDCSVSSATADGICTWHCNYYIKNCTQYKCC